MKISQDLRPVFDKRKIEKRQVSQNRHEFRTLLAQEKTQLHEERLHALLSEIRSQGEKLAQTRTVKELYQYKRLIERFIKEAVDFGMELKHSSSWSFSGRMESYTLVERINEELLELTDMVLEEGRNAIDILGKVGEIEGLLINLYT